MDAGQLHLTNKRVLLHLIKEAGTISRSELSKETGLTPPTITRIVGELVDIDGLVEHVGPGNSNGGRPSMLAKFKCESNCIIGIDLGATYIRGCLVDLNANFISEIEVPTEMEKGFDSIIEKVVKLVDRLQHRKDDSFIVWGVGIGVAGLVNRKTGIIESSPDFGWTEVDLRKSLEDKIRLPFFYDNSTRLMALGELKLGKNNNLKNFAMINIGYGIASGLVVEGNLVRGDKGYAGELGHIQVVSDSNVKCKCGKYGCLEALASGHRIASLGKELLKLDKADYLRELCNDNADMISAELVAIAAKRGDKDCINIYREVSKYLCKGIGSIANVLNPELIYIGGGISLSGDLLFDSIEESKAKYLLSANDNLKILPASYGEQATVIGAVSLILDKILNLNLTHY